MAERRIFITDEDIAKRISHELKLRGRDATNVYELKIKGKKDPVVLDALHERFADRDWVLITADDHLPADHADDVARLRPTLAIMDPQRDAGFTREEWHHEIVHRWAHVIEEQASGTVRRYSASTHVAWNQPRRIRPVPKKHPAPASASKDNTEGTRCRPEYAGGTPRSGRSNMKRRLVHAAS